MFSHSTGMSGLIYIFVHILTKNFIDIVYRLWVSAKCVVLFGILVVWIYFNGPWPIIEYYQKFYLYNLSRFTFLNKKSLNINYRLPIIEYYRICVLSFNMDWRILVNFIPRFWLGIKYYSLMFSLQVEFWLVKKVLLKLQGSRAVTENQ